MCVCVCVCVCVCDGTAVLIKHGSDSTSNLLTDLLVG